MVALVTLLCVASRCAQPRQHTTGCKGGQCRGCLPAQAEVGRLCERCFQRAASTLTDIGELYYRLAGGEEPVVDTRTLGPPPRSGRT